MQVSRKTHLNIPKEIPLNIENINSIEDEMATKKAVAIANHKKFEKEETMKKLQERDDEWEKIVKIPSNANDLIAVTVVKKLGAYIIAATEKSPAKYRGVFVNRLQNYCLEVLEELIRANFIRMDSHENKVLRENHQLNAIVKLKMLGYIAMVAENAKCILAKQYKQISIQIGESINLIAAWKRSDDDRWKNK